MDRRIDLYDLRQLKPNGRLESLKEYAKDHDSIILDSEILKKYLTGQFNMEVDSKTSREIINRLKSLHLNYDFVRQIEICIKDLDFAKYSSFNKSVKDMEGSMDLFYVLLK